MKSSRRPAFTLIELVIVVAILAMLSVLVIVNLTGSRRSANDSRRKTDVKEYVAAIQKYKLTSGSAYVAASNGSGAGAENSSYGKMNYKGAAIGGVSYNTSSTIAESLKAAGVVGTIATDPSSGGDYILVRCDANGSQELGQNDATFAIWAKLQNAPTAIETENSSHYCGGSHSGAPAPRPEFASDTMTAPSAQSGAINASTPENASKYFSIGDSKLQ